MRAIGDTSDMPFFRRSQHPPQVHAYDHTSIELDGFEVTIGKVAPFRLNPAELKFSAGLIERSDRAKRTGSAHGAHVDVQTLIERHESTQDVAFRTLCARGIELLGADGGRISLAAQRTADAADVFLRTSATPDTLDWQFARDVRQFARETHQHRIDGAFNDLTFRPSSPGLAQANFAHAVAMKDAFGVFHAADELGLDFILDAQGKPAYAFKPMTVMAPRALSLSRLHCHLADTLNKNVGFAVPLGQSRAHLVQMPGSWSGLRADDPQHAVSDAAWTLGLLMRAPPDFDLCLSKPDDAEGEARARLTASLTREGSPRAMEALALVALCAGESRSSREGVLVDEAGRPWILQPERYLAEPEEDSRDQTTAAAEAPVPSSPDADQGMPMRLDLQRALAQLSASMSADVIARRCSPTERELALVAKAVGLSGPGSAEAALALWPSRAVVQRCADQILRLSDWARSCVATREQLLGQPAEETEDLAALAERHASLNWYLSTVDVRNDA
ncbi:hypothetical protein CDL60_05555 [Roseateles noduli]|nr:hypothetical protein CDL60_05555 [Roseateles noduli]